MADVDFLMQTFGLGLYRQKWLFAKGRTKKSNGHTCVFFFIFANFGSRTSPANFGSRTSARELLCP